MIPHSELDALPQLFGNHDIIAIGFGSPPALWMTDEYDVVFKGGGFCRDVRLHAEPRLAVRLYPQRNNHIHIHIPQPLLTKNTANIIRVISGKSVKSVILKPKETTKHEKNIKKPISFKKNRL